MSRLSWNRAATIAAREMRAAPGKFAFVVLSVAIGVAALVGVRGFSESFRTTLLGEARTLMAADVAARMFRLPNAEETQKLSKLPKQGVTYTWVTEMVSMAAAPPDPVPMLVSVKAVDPALYPFYGEPVLRPAGSLRAALRDDTVVVGEDLLIRLHTQVGQQLRLGGHLFRIAAVLAKEPDRVTASAGLGPRLLMTRSALEATGLMVEESRASQKLLVKIAPNGPNVETARRLLENALPDAQVTDFRESNPAITDGMDHATGILSLICLVAMVLGAIGVAMAMRAHLAQRMDSIAVLKTLGARSTDILKIYLLQTLGLGVLGGLLGIAAGVGVEVVLPLVLGRLLPIRPVIGFPLRSSFMGLCTGVLTTLLFCLPPLLDVRTVRPVRVLRRDMEEEPVNWVQWLKSHIAQLGACALILAGLTGIAVVLADSGVVGRWFALLLVIALLFLLLAASLMLRTLRAFLGRTRLSLPSTLRHGLANLYRPGNQSAAILAALGLGVMLILGVYLVQSSMLRQMTESMSGTLPNAFFVDISSHELEGMSKLVAQVPGVRGGLQPLPVVQTRVLKVDGVRLEDMHLPNLHRGALQNIPLTWSDTAPEGDSLVEGEWWSSPQDVAIAVSEHTAERFQIKVGSRLDMQAGTRTFQPRVAAIFHADGQHLFGRSEWIAASGMMQGLPTTWYGAVHIDAGQVGEMERRVFDQYPTVTVISLADVLETLERVLGQITLVVRFLASFSMLAGIAILASSVAATRFRRMREVMVLKTLGATRGRAASVFAVEFIALGLLAGVVGGVFANVLAEVLLKKMNLSFSLAWGAIVFSMVAAALLSAFTGWAASWGILNQRPVEILREQ